TCRTQNDPRGHYAARLRGFHRRLLQGAAHSDARCRVWIDSPWRTAGFSRSGLAPMRVPSAQGKARRATARAFDTTTDCGSLVLPDDPSGVLIQLPGSPDLR